MSARKTTLRLSQESDRDYEDIGLYTRRVWGPARQARYKAAIAEAFRRLRDLPRIGQPRDDLFRGCREMQVEQHLNLLSPA